MTDGWLYGPLQLQYFPSVVQVGQASVFGPSAAIGYTGRDLHQVDPRDWGEPRPIWAKGVVYETEQGTDPVGGPRLRVTVTSSSPTFSGGSNFQVTWVESPTGLIADLPAANSATDPVIWSGSLPAGAFPESALFDVDVAARAYGFYMGTPFGDPLTHSYLGLMLQAAWLYVPPGYQYLRVAPLHQRARTDGLGGGPMHQSPGLASRQLGGRARGIY